MNSETRENEIKGSLDDRVLKLEQSLDNKWENWFGRHPGAVLGIVIAALFTGFWLYHTWQVNRIDNQHAQEISRLLTEHESRLTWIREQQEAKLQSQNDKCAIENQRLSVELESCAEAKLNK